MRYKSMCDTETETNCIRRELQKKRIVALGLVSVERIKVKFSLVSVWWCYAKCCDVSPRCGIAG